jgi:hypothetical protein
MNRSFIAGVLSGVKAFDGKTKFAFAKIGVQKEYQGQAYMSNIPVVLFKELADKAIKLDNTFVVFEGYAKNSKYTKNGQDTYKLELVGTSLEASPAYSDSNAPIQSSQPSSEEDIPF